MPQNSPNLLSQQKSNFLNKVERHDLTISAVAKITIILIQTAFVILLGANAASVAGIRDLETQIRAMELQLQNYSAAETESRQVIRKIEILKSLQAERPSLSEKLNLAFEQIPGQVNITQVVVQQDKMGLIMDTPSPLDASLLINSYFTKNLANQVILNNVNLSPTTGRFITDMEVEFR